MIYIFIPHLSSSTIPLDFILLCHRQERSSHASSQIRKRANECSAMFTGATFHSFHQWAHITHAQNTLRLLRFWGIVTGRGRCLASFVRCTHTGKEKDMSIFLGCNISLTLAGWDARFLLPAGTIHIFRSCEDGGICAPLAAVCLSVRLGHFTRPALESYGHLLCIPRCSQHARLRQGELQFYL